MDGDFDPRQKVEIENGHIELTQGASFLGVRGSQSKLRLQRTSECLETA